MNVKRVQSVNFTGIVHVNNQDAQNPVLRPLINHLKHNCGSNKVHHFIHANSYKNDIFEVASVYAPKSPINGAKQFIRTLGVVSPSPAENVNNLIKLIDNTKSWFNDIRVQEKINLKKYAIK